MHQDLKETRAKPCEKLEEKLAKAGYRIGERLQVGSTIGAHVGPGAYAMIFVIK